MEIEDDIIRTRPCPNCYICGTRGEPLYQGLQDRLFGCPGTWDLKKCANSGCGLLWLDPMPVEEDIAKAYRNYQTHRDVQIQNNWLRRIYRYMREVYLSDKYGYPLGTARFYVRVLSRLIYLYPARHADFDYSASYLHAQPGGRLLDVGCGNGAMLRLMQDRGWRVEGIDVDPEAVSNARAKGLKVHHGSLLEQEFLDGTFDAIVMNHVIEHVPEPDGLLRECHRILKVGGRLVIVTPNVSSMLHKKFRQKWRGLEPPRHLHLFTRSSLQILALNERFTVVSLWTSIRGAPGIYFQTIEWLLKKLKPDVGEELILIAEK